MKQLTFLLFLFLLSLKSNGQVNLDLNFYPLEASDTLNTLNKKLLEESIQTNIKGVYLIKNYKNVSGLYIIAENKKKWFVFDVSKLDGYDNNDDIQIKGNFITYTTFHGGSARQTTYFSSNLILVNFITLSYNIITVQSNYEAWNVIEKRPNENDETYEKRSEKEYKVTRSICNSKLNFDGLYMSVSRTYKDKCKDCVVCIEPGTYKFVKDKFIKIVKPKK